MKGQPKWSTPIRKLHLATVYVDVNDWSVDIMTGEFYNFDYEARIKPLIADWKQSDREQRQAEWNAERKVMHSLGERTYPITGRFNAISMDIYHSNQPLYYLEGQAVSGLTIMPFVKVRLASSYVRLYIDLGKELRQVSKNKRRKAIRYGKPLPQETEAIIRRKVLLAVRDYLDNQS